MFPISETEPVERGEVTIALIAVNVFAFLLEIFPGQPGSGSALVTYGAFVPAHPAWYRWITSQFLHGGLWHIAGNMWALWIFGHRVERRLGPRYLPFYLAGGCCANLAQLAADPSSTVPCLGASGAIAAVLGLYAVLFPKARLRFWQPIEVLPPTYTLSALVFGAIFLIGEWNDLASSAATGVAHGAHLGGLAFGILVGLALRSPKDAAASAEARALQAAAQEQAAERAAHAVVDQLYGGPLDDLGGATALALGDKLAAARRWPLARAWLERLTEREPESEAGSYAWLLLGYVYSEGFKDPGAAAEAYDAVLRLARAPGAVAQARERLSAARGALAGAKADLIDGAGAAAIIVDCVRGAAPGWRAAAEKLAAQSGLALAASGRGVVAAGEAERAREALARLREQGLPVAAVPVDWLAAPGPAVSLTSLTPMPEGLLGDESRLLRWSGCRAVAAYALETARLVPKTLGVLDVEFENFDGRRTSLFEGDGDESALDAERAWSYVIEAIGSSGERWRWSVDSDASVHPSPRGLRRVVALGIAAKAGPGVLLNEALGRWALGDDEPADWRFADQEPAAAELSWLAALARARRLL